MLSSGVCVKRLPAGRMVVTGKSFEHRRAWIRDRIRDRMESLASVFAVDCLTYTVLSNHLHVVLRSQPDVAKEWTDEEQVKKVSY